MATQVELLKQAMERVRAKYGPDALSLKDLQTQIDSIESSEATRLRAGEIESAKSERYAAQVIRKAK